METTLLTPLHRQGADDSEMEITRVNDDDVDLADTVRTSHDPVDFEDTLRLHQCGPDSTTLVSTPVSPAEAPPVAERPKCNPRAFDRDSRFELGGEHLQKIHAAIDDALAGAPLSSVPSVDASRARVTAPPMTPATRRRSTPRWQIAAVLGGALLVTGATALAVLSLLT
jgi:hypothetical protein